MKQLFNQSLAGLAVLLMAGPVLAGEPINKTFKGVKELDIDLVSGDCIIEVGKGTEVALKVEDSYPEGYFTPEIAQRGSRLVLKEDFSGRGFRGHSSWILTVPREMDIIFEGASSDFSLEGVKGTVEVDNASGSITIENAEGNFDLDNASGRIEVTASTGRFRIDNASGRVIMEDVSGDFDVDNASGDVKLANATGRFKLDNASGDVFAKGIVFEEFSTLSTASGNIEVLLGKTLEQDLELSSASGDVEINYGGRPITGRFLFSARKGWGKIVSPFPFDSEKEFERWDHIYTEKIFTRGKDSPRVSLKTSTGRVALHKK